MSDHAEEFYRRANLARHAGRNDAAILLDQAGDAMRSDGKVPVVIDGRAYRVHPATAAVLNRGEK